jgi:hypothetical protein
MVVKWPGLLARREDNEAATELFEADMRTELADFRGEVLAVTVID